MLSYIKHITLLIFVLLASSNYAQNKPSAKGRKAERAKNKPAGTVLLTGDVVITHQGTKILCDQSYWNNTTKDADATGNIKIYRADSKYPLHGDRLLYNGETSLARLRKNVYYKDEQVSFTTEKFNYNTATEIGYYFDGGIVKDSVNTLISKRGYIYKNNDIIVKDSVVVTTPDYLILSDSVKYNSATGMVHIIAPTTLYSDSSTLYAEGGYYDTKRSYAYLTDNAEAKQASYSMTGDIVTYLKEEKKGEAFGNIAINDTVQKLMLKGNYGYFDGNIDYAYVTDSAQILLYTGIDTLFAHADTLYSYKDTADVQYFAAYHNVRFFRIDIQGKCDSLVYNMSDSIGRMYHEPMMWSLWNQMSGEEIHIYNKNNVMDHMELINDAFIASREDSLRFSQVRGKTIFGYIHNNTLSKIDVDGNAESLYYSREGNAIVGYNQTESSYLTMLFKNGQINRLSLRPASTGTFYKVDSKPYEEQFLRGFQWRSDLRPTSPEDIFRRTPVEVIKKKRRIAPRKK